MSGGRPADALQVQRLPGLRIAIVQDRLQGDLRSGGSEPFAPRKARETSCRDVSLPTCGSNLRDFSSATSKVDATLQRPLSDAQHAFRGELKKDLDRETR